MKAIRMRIEKSSRPLVILLATVVVIITCVVIANATQTITTPNAVNIPYSLAAGADSAAITPVTDKPVLVMAICTTSSVGAGQVTLVHIPSGGMTWIGVDRNTANVVVGETSTPGFIMFVLDNAGSVVMEVASADTIKIHNGATGTRAGNVTLIW